MDPVLGPRHRNRIAFFKSSLINIHCFVDKSVVFMMSTDAVMGCFSVNGTNSLSVFLGNS